MPPLNSVPFFEKAYYIKKKYYSNFCTFEIASLVNFPGHYLRKYGILLLMTAVGSNDSNLLKKKCKPGGVSG